METLLERIANSLEIIAKNMTCGGTNTGASASSTGSSGVSVDHPLYDGYVTALEKFEAAVDISILSGEEKTAVEHIISMAKKIREILITILGTTNPGPEGMLPIVTPIIEDNTAIMGLETRFEYQHIVQEACTTMSWFATEQPFAHIDGSIGGVMFWINRLRKNDDAAPQVKIYQALYAYLNEVKDLVKEHAKIRLPWNAVPGITPEKVLGGKAAESAPKATTPAPAAAPAPAPTKPKGEVKPKKTPQPVFKLIGNRWMVSNQKDGKTFKIDQGPISQTVYMARCQETTLVVPHKVNAVTVDNCKDCVVTVNRTVSVVELVGCKNVTVVIEEYIPTLNIDKCSECEVRLYKMDSVAQIVTAASNGTGVRYINPDLDPSDRKAETVYAIPEQFASSFEMVKDKMKLISRPAEQESM